MSPVPVGLCSARQTLLVQGVEAVLERETGFHLAFSIRQVADLYAAVRTTEVTVILLATSESDDPVFDKIVQLKRELPDKRFMVLAHNADQKTVFNAIRCGAGGLICADADPQELKEAILTLRNGHEFFSKSITHLLVNNYVAALHGTPGAMPRELQKLGKRELEVLTLWGEGLTNAEIAGRLFLSVRTIESHKNHIMAKLQLRTTVDLVRFAVRNNIISL